MRENKEMKKGNILEVSNLSVTLNREEIIKDLSFQVEKGEVLIVLGPNGAGKTTLLKALLGSIPYQGDIRWASNKISYLPPNELLMRREMLPLTVEDFFSLKGVDIREVKENLESVGLNEKIAKRRIANLSTGQFQRLNIAWALAKKPEVLIFDEPTSGIDVGGTETVYSLLHSFWKKYGMTIILVTHDLNIVWEHADNVLCLNQKGLCYGPPRKLLTTKKLEELCGAGIKHYEHKYR